MASATTGALRFSTVMTRRPFFRVVCLKSTRTLRGACAAAAAAWTKRVSTASAAAQTRGTRLFALRRIMGNSFCFESGTRGRRESKTDTNEADCNYGRNDKRFHGLDNIAARVQKFGRNPKKRRG